MNLEAAFLFFFFFFFFFLLSLIVRHIRLLYTLSHPVKLFMLRPLLGL